MLKKYFILTMLFFAYTIVLAHSIVPHHHHNEGPEMGQSSNQNDDKINDHHPDKGLAHDFSHYFHSGNLTDFHIHSELNSSDNSVSTIFIVALFYFHFDPTENQTSIVPSFKDHFLVLEYSLSSKGLRAPPSLLG
jgi:hypothetical protein